MGYLSRIGVLDGLPDYIGSGLLLSTLRGKSDSLLKPNTVLLNTAEISEDERTPISNLHYSLLRWAVVTALVDYAAQQRSIALKARWSLFDAVSQRPKLISSMIRAVPKSLSRVRKAVLILECLHDELIDRGDLTRHLSDPLKSLYKIRQNTRTSITSDINYRLGRLLKPVRNLLTITESSGSQFLHTSLLLSNRRLQIALVLLSIALLVQGGVQLYKSI